MHFAPQEPFAFVKLGREQCIKTKGWFAKSLSFTDKQKFQDLTLQMVLTMYSSFTHLQGGYLSLGAAEQQCKLPSPFLFPETYNSRITLLLVLTVYFYFIHLQGRDFSLGQQKYNVNCSSFSSLETYNSRMLLPLLFSTSHDHCSSQHQEHMARGWNSNRVNWRNVKPSADTVFQNNNSTLGTHDLRLEQQQCKLEDCLAYCRQSLTKWQLNIRNVWLGAGTATV